MRKFYLRTSLKTFLICAMLGLGSCATLSPAECQTADWYRIGERDGSTGYQSRLDQHYKACQKVNILPNQSLYIQGYHAGLQYYCQPQVILNAALSGKGNSNVCPVQSRATLDSIAQVGNAVYRTEHEQQRLETRRKELLSALDDKKLSQSDRLKRSEELNEVYAKMRRNEVELQSAQHELKKVKRQYNLK